MQRDFHHGLLLGDEAARRGFHHIRDIETMPSVFDRLRTGLRRTAQRMGDRFDEILGREDKQDTPGPVKADTLDALEELLLEADVGVTATDRIIETLRSDHSTSVTPDTPTLRDALRQEILAVLASVHKVPAARARPRVVLVVGVNGTGKTTTVGKLAHLLRTDGQRPLVCAADTFRAAAVQQLEVWASRADVDIVKAGPQADPASVVFDAVEAGRARDCDVVLVDTAGRLHTRVNLMTELEKMRRVAARAIDGAPHEVLLIIDATVGQNGLAQAKVFLESAGVTGIVLTKLDGTAKGGIALAIAAELGLPIQYVGVGEGIGDLLPFDAEAYADGLFASQW